MKCADVKLAQILFAGMRLPGTTANYNRLPAIIQNIFLPSEASIPEKGEINTLFFSFVT